ncbi:MAG: DUF6036 family nucleotidyltransferase [Acidimicrobiaceae bacterium]|nr:DUF6036 family nucleotidyltransferase [Acidimicrobiaceae bacterium]
MQPLSASEIRDAFDDLAQRLARRGVVARLYVAGGAAMALMYDENRLTRDVDASISAGYDDVMAAAHEIARERGWPTTWINEQATMYMPPEQDRHGEIAYEHPSLSVVVASAEQMIAMKARSARRTDESDLRRLLTHQEISDAEGVDEIVARVFPGEQLGPRQTRWVQEIVRSANDDRGSNS